MSSQIIVILVILGICTYGSAVYQMIRGQYHPSFFSRGVWFLLGINTLFAVLMSDQSVGSKVLATILFTGNLLVFIISYYKGSRIFGFIEKLSLALIAISTIVLFGFDAPYIGLLFTLFTHFIGGIPTLWRIMKDPHSEQAYHWYFFFIACCITVTINGFSDLKSITMPLYFMLFDAAIILLVNRKYLLK